MPRILALALALSCAAGHADAGSSPASAPEPKSDAAVLATLERGACYGICPIYKLTVFADGRLEFDGTRWVKAHGTHTATLSKAQVAALRQAFAKAHYLALDDRYVCAGITDQSTVTSSFAPEAGHSKSVVHYRGCDKAPEALDALEAAIDRIAKTERWVGTRKERDRLHDAGKLR